MRLAGDALDLCRRRVQQDLHCHRGRAGDPLYAARRLLHTGTDLLTTRQDARLKALFAAGEHVEVEATWGVYQAMIAAYRKPDRARGRRPDQRRRADRAGRDRHARADPDQARSRRAGLLRTAQHVERTDRVHQRPPRTPPRLRTRLPQPHQLHRPIPPRDRRIQTPTTPSIVKSPRGGVVDP